MVTRQYLIGGLVLLFVLGAVLGALDSRFGVRLRRWLWTWTHSPEDTAGLPSNGFVYGRRAKDRFTVALVLWALGTFFGIRWSEVNPFYLILAVFAEVPVLMAGFYASPFVDRFWARTGDVLEHVDRLESGETTLREELAEAQEAVRDAFHPDDGSSVAAVLRQAEQAKPTPLAEPESPAEKDPRAVLDRFSSGGRRGRR